MQVVVTGASGFLGGAIIKMLSNAGVSSLGISRKDVPGCLKVTKYSDTPPADVLIHLAEINNRARVNDLSAEYEFELETTLHSLLKKGYKQVIYASSSTIYCDEFCSPRMESDPVSVTDTYTHIKLAAEKSVLSYGGAVVRLGNLYGPGMASENVVSDILAQLNQSGPILLRNTSPIRDFIWIEDAAEAFLKIVTRQLKGLFNVGTGIGTSIEELAKILLAKVNQPERLILSEQSLTKPSCIILDITKARKYLQWEPSVLLNEGLGRLVGSQRGMDLV